MEPLKPSAPTVRNLESSVTEAGYERPKGVNNSAQEDDVSAMASPNETHAEEGTTWKTTRSGRFETEEEEASSKANGCFGARLCKKKMPEGGWRRRAGMTVFVSVLFVVIVSVCSLPTILYFSALVNVYLVILKAHAYTKRQCCFNYVHCRYVCMHETLLRRARWAMSCACTLPTTVAGA